MAKNRYAFVILFEENIDIIQAAEESDITELVEFFYTYGDHETFDWKEEEKKDQWVDKMKRKGFVVIFIDDGSDSFNVAAIPSEKMKLIDFALDQYTLEYEIL